MSRPHTSDELEALLRDALKLIDSIERKLASSPNFHDEVLARYVTTSHEDLQKRYKQLLGTKLWLNNTRNGLFAALTLAGIQLRDKDIPNATIHANIWGYLCAFDIALKRIDNPRKKRAREFCECPLNLLRETISKIATESITRQEIYEWIDAEIIAVNANPD